MQQKPPRWNVSPALIDPTARGLWKDLAFVAPLWGGAGRGALLGPHGGPLAGANLVEGSTLQWRGTPYGAGGGISGASNFVYQDNLEIIKTSSGLGLGDFTLVCLADPIAEARVSHGVSQDAGGLVRTSLSFNSGSNQNIIASGQFAFVTRNSTSVAPLVVGGIDGNYHLFAGRRRGTTCEAWIDGVMRATATDAAARDIANDTMGFALGNRAESTAERIATTTTLVFAAGWNRALSDAEMRLLARDAFVMFRPTIEWRGVWTPLGGGDVVLQPTDILDSLSFESAAFSQAHVLSGSDLNLAASFETPGLLSGAVLNPAKLSLSLGFESPALSQSHIFAAQELNCLFAFETALLTTGGGVAPGFRSRAMDADVRNTEISNETRSRAIVAGKSS